MLNILQKEDTKQHSKWDSNITFNDFVSGFLHWRETTSTSPSGRHLVIYCSLVTTHCDSRGEFEKEKDKGNILIQDKATSILKIIH